MSNSLQHKILQYESKPPEPVWDKIADSLDHQEHEFVSRMLNFEDAPPSGTWEKISKNLGAEELDNLPQKAVVRRFSFLRYATAATVLLVLVAGLIWNFSSKENSTDRTSFKKIGSADSNKVAQSPEAASFETNPVSETTTRKHKAEVRAQNHNSAPTTEKPSERYLTVANDEGKKVRLSRKVMSVFDCAENATAVNSTRCKESIKSLQQKMSASLVSPSGDFAGLVDMIKTLEENN